MKLIKAEIKNFRLLNDVTISLDEHTTSIVGKNNSGKTSFSAIFEIFLSEKKTFKYEDFSFLSHAKFIEIFNKFKSSTPETKEEVMKEILETIPKIQLMLTIQYDDADNWAVIKPFLIGLAGTDPISILCEYAPKSTEKFLEHLKAGLLDTDYSDAKLLKKIEMDITSFYSFSFRPYSSTEETANVDRQEILNLFSTKFINAQRSLDDGNSESKSKLSKVFHGFFKQENENSSLKSEELLEAIGSTNDKIDTQLCSFFVQFVEHFNTFGFPGLGNEDISLKSNMDPEVLFNHNVKLFYNHNGKSLPEKYNGLGYSNLIFIISEIIGYYNTSKDIGNNLKLIFIEEPEAHMHPQMQTVFINKVNDFLVRLGLKAQVIITTHSSHILANSQFECIRYFSKDSSSSKTVVKDLMDFNNTLTTQETKEFLQQYLTLGKCDLFFADKAILFEGTVERILLPVFIKKIDKVATSKKLSEQYISSIEIGGAYMDKFKELLEFLALKTLVITDLDSVEPVNRGKNEVLKGNDLITSNPALKNWIPQKTNIDELLNPAVVKFNTNESIMVTYQHCKAGSDKCGRSFEEAFIIDNYHYVFDNKEELTSIKNNIHTHITADEIKNNSYSIQKYIDTNKKKTDFTFDLLTVDQEAWQVPEYISEGLVWLAE